jgi:hypothetical protein
MSIDLDVNMLVDIAKTESFYFVLISKHLLAMKIPKLIEAYLVPAFVHFIRKYKTILFQLDNYDDIPIIINPLEYQNGDLSRLLDNLTALSCIDTDDIIAFYSMTPDEQSAKKIQTKKKIFCKNAKWTMGHLMNLYSSLLKSLNAEDLYGVVPINTTTN